MAQHVEAGAEQRHDDADLKRCEDAGYGVGDALVRLNADGDRGCLKEALAGFSAHVKGELLIGAELVNEAAVDFALELEDPVPAAVFEELPDQPGEGGEKAGESQQGRHGPNHIVGVPAAAGRSRILGPDGAFQGFVRAAVFRSEAGEEIKVGIAGDFRVFGEELGQLRVVVGYVVLIGQQGWIVGDDGGEGGAGAQKLE